MKNSIKFLKPLAFCMTLFFMSSCTNEIGGDSEFPVIPASNIKQISYDSGDGIESWEFTYDSNNKVTSIANVYDGGTPEMINYDYSQPGMLIINKAGNITDYVVDSEGRVVKELWNDDGSEYAAFVYDAEGFLVNVLEHYSGSDHLKFVNTINNTNITNRVRYEDDGVTVREDRIFEYTIAANPSSIHQTFTVDSQWKTVGGFYGRQSKKLAKNYVRRLASDPDSSYGATFDYTFDDQNRVATQTKNGTGSGGSFTESWSYTYYDN